MTITWIPEKYHVPDNNQSYKLQEKMFQQMKKSFLLQLLYIYPKISYVLCNLQMSVDQ